MSAIPNVSNSARLALGIPKLSETELARTIASTNGRVREASVPAEFPASRLFVPTDGKPHPGVVLLHGAEGGDAGYVHRTAVELATRGLAAFSLAYYGAPGLPAKILELPVERTFQAARWFKGCEHVDGSDLGLYGVSRGAEQSLLASNLDQGRLFKALAVQSGSSKVNPGFDPRGGGTLPDLEGRAQAAYTVGGRKVLPGPQRVDRFPGPVLIAHGTRDGRFPVQDALELRERLSAAGRPPEVKIFPGQGHSFKRTAQRHADQLFADFFEKHLSP